MQPDPNTSAHIAVHGTRLDRLEKDLAEVRETVQELRDLMLQARGGVKTALLIGSAGGAIGAILVKLAPLIGIIPR